MYTKPQTPTHKGNAMNNALIFLKALLIVGYEFPDAAHKAARVFQVKQTELESLYDTGE
jgi:hypothetical protein